MNRWYIYQKERFPLAAHAPLIAAFSSSAVCYSALLRGSQSPEAISFVVAFLVSLGSFLLLRIADEFKDAEEDARYRPYRPVPRGLVTLKELRTIGIVVGALQLGLASLVGVKLIGLLVVTWIYFALMSHEFFAREWLKARPVTYLFSHMLIMPLIDWFATGCDWVRSGEGMPAGLFWFLAASFCNGIVIEIGRKIRAPEQEETGVQTYTVLWGRAGAVAAWSAAQAATFLCAYIAADRIDFAITFAGVVGSMWIISVVVAIAFVRRQTARLAKSIEALSGVWTLALYLTLGVLPLCSRL
jgi:4-hydroxybenzoate polyprenyltransferase